MPDPAAQKLSDQFGRPLSDLRVSVTDRCNFRCSYCLPRSKTSEQAFLPRADIITFEETARIARAFVSLGVRKIRLTGGEPLLRRELARLVSMLAELGVELALTTNGVLLPRYARDLREAGLDRITVSLDALDEGVFQAVCDAPGFSPSDVLRGIEAAESEGFGPIKINCAVRRGENEDQVAKIARHFFGSGHVVRFIEFMDVGTRNEWRLAEVVTATEIRQALGDIDELMPVDAKYRGEVAKRYLYKNGGGEVGVIASVSAPFCGDCTRARLSSDGQLYSCLFARKGTDVRGLVRSGASDQEISALIFDWWERRADRYSEARSLSGAEPSARSLPVLNPKVEMSFIGG